MRVPDSPRLHIVAIAVVCVLAAPGSVWAQAKKPVPAKPAPKAAPKVVPPAPAAAAPAPPAPAPPPPPAEDLVVKMRYVSGDKTTTSTVSMKGRRQRIDYGPDLAVLQQCGVPDITQVNDLNRKFLTVENRPGAPAKTPKKGGTITYATTLTDTGERKTLFGMTARHVKTVLTKTSTPNACDKRKERVETDGWFVDPPALMCPAPPRPAAVTTDDCSDTVEYVDPPANGASYPLAYTATTTDNEGKTSTMSMEVTEYAKSTLADAVFAVPMGFAEAPNLMQFNAFADGRKRPGVVRTCSSSVTGKPEYQVPLDTLSDALVVSLGDAGLDAVRLSARTAADERAETQSRECDFVLTTDITDVRKPGKGVLGRVSWTTSGFGAKVDFKMTAPGGKVAALSSSERSGASNLKVAIGAAKTVSRYVTPLGLLGSSFGSMSAFAALGGGASGPAMEQSSDPVMNTVFLLVDKATGADKPEPELVSEEAAVAAAMEQEVKAVAAFVLKKPK